MMNKHLIALTALALTTGAACAQSSVSLYGIVDVAVRATKTGDVSKKSEGSDGNAGSRFGFKGTEDLGNGLSAGFVLEGPLSADTGTGSTTKLFNRRSTVSLMGGFGEARLGRDNVTIWTNAADFDPFGTVGVGTVTNLIGKLGATVDYKRADNVVSYFLPGTLGGVYGQLQGGFGEGQAGRTDGARVGYKAGPLNVAVAGTSIVSGSGVTTDGRYKLIHGGATYDFNIVKLWAEYYDVKRVVNGAADRKQKIWELALTAPVGASGVAKVAYAKASDYAPATKFAIGYQHNLSKRTALYATFAQIKNKIGDTGAVSTFTVADAPAASGTVAQKSSGYEFGIRHSF